MSLLTDPAFLVYQLRVSLLRTNDPTARRVVTFDDLSVPHAGVGGRGSSGSVRSRHGSTPSPMTPPGRRRTSASEVRQQVALNTAANAYIMACGHYPETDTVGSPEIEYDEGYIYSRGAPRLAFAAGGADSGVGPPPSARYPGGGNGGATGRNKRTNRSAKIAPTGEGREEVVGLGVVPPHAEMMLGAYNAAPAAAAFPQRSIDATRRRPLPAVAEIVDSGSLSDGAQGPAPAAAHWAPEDMPPRRSLDTIRRPDHLRRAGHVHSNSMATIRLQRPHELLRKGSSRDAIALGIEFDVRSMFEGADAAAVCDVPPVEPVPGPPDVCQPVNEPADEPAGVEPARAGRAGGARQRQRVPDGSPARKKSAAGIELRARRNEPALRIPLASTREERTTGSSLLKRSATLPTKRTYGHGAGGGAGAGQKSKWVGAYAEPRARHAGGASGWVGGAGDTGWDHSSEDGDNGDDCTPLSRRGANTHTWFGPSAATRPISMFPAPGPNAPFPMPPVPLMFGADDSDDDIDLEGDEGSSRTPAELGMGLGLARGLRPHAHSPSPSTRSRGGSATPVPDWLRAARFAPRPSALAASVPLSSPLTSPAAPSAVPGAAHSGLAPEGAGSRPRGLSDPEGLQSSRNSHVPPGPSRPASDDGIPLLAVSAAATGARPPTSSGQPAVRSLLQRGSEGKTSLAGAGAAAGTAPYLPPLAPKQSGLAALLATKMTVRQNPFSEEFGGVGSAAGEGSPVKLSLFVQHGERRSPSLTVRVRKTATVEQAIGFALYQYIEDECEPPLEDDAQDVVMWSLRIAMDGEVDDDFPAFDRTLPVANFAFDEFALCQSTPDQVRANEAIRMRLGRPPRMLRARSQAPPPSSAATPGPAPASAPANQELLFQVVPRSEARAAVLQPSRMATASTAGIFAGSALLNRPSDNSSLAAADQERARSAASSATQEPSQVRLLKIHVQGESSSAHALRATTIEASTGATIRTVLAQVCRKRHLLEDQYVLGILDQTTGFAVCSSDTLMGHLPADAQLYLHRVGTALPSLGHAPAPIFGRQPSIDNAVVLLAPEASAVGVPSAYYTFRVTRRAQMFTRHERSLVIDGETITLLPAEHRTEPAKTLTFHISNVICKRNQKSLRKIRLLITRRGNTGEKSVDLEAQTDEDATSICNILVRLREAYAATAV